MYQGTISVFCYVIHYLLQVNSESHGYGNLYVAQAKNKAESTKQYIHLARHVTRQEEIVQVTVQA